VNILSSNNEKPFRDSHQQEKSMLIVLLFIKPVPGVRSLGKQLDQKGKNNWGLKRKVGGGGIKVDSLAFLRRTPHSIFLAVFRAAPKLTKQFGQATVCMDCGVTSGQLQRVMGV